MRRGSEETHEMAQRKLQQMEKLRGAFGLSTDANEGDAFNPEVQEAKRVAEREKRDVEKKVCPRVEAQRRPLRCSVRGPKMMGLEKHGAGNVVWACDRRAESPSESS